MVLVLDHGTLFVAAGTGNTPAVGRGAFVASLMEATSVPAGRQQPSAISQHSISTIAFPRWTHHLLQSRVEFSNVNNDEARCRGLC